MYPQVGRLVSVLLIVRMTPITTMTNQPSGELLETSSATVRVCERVSECVCVCTHNVTAGEFHMEFKSTVKS